MPHILKFDFPHDGPSGDEMHTARLQQFGFHHIRAKSLEVHEGLTAITRGPLDS